MFTLLQSFKTVGTFVILKNTLDYVKSLASKLQQRDMDIYFALKMIDDPKYMIFVVTFMRLSKFGINKYKLLLILLVPLKKHREEQKLKDLDPTSQHSSKPTRVLQKISINIH